MYGTHAEHGLRTEDHRDDVLGAGPGALHDSPKRLRDLLVLYIEGIALLLVFAPWPGHDRMAERLELGDREGRGDVQRSPDALASLRDKLCA